MFQWCYRLCKIFGANVRQYSIDEHLLPCDVVLNNGDCLYALNFFVRDGGVLFTDCNVAKELSQDEFCNYMHFLLGRYERNASNFYGEYAADNDMFADEDI